MTTYVLAIPDTTPVLVTSQVLQDTYPNTIFPPDLAGMEADFHIYPLTSDPLPRYDPATEKVEEGPITGSGRTWTRTWAVAPLVNDEPHPPAAGDAEEKLKALEARVAALEAPKLNS